MRPLGVNAKGALSLLAWGNAPGLMEFKNTRALKARFSIRAVVSAVLSGLSSSVPNQMR
jgi:hypothetical protein